MTGTLGALAAIQCFAVSVVTLFLLSRLFVKDTSEFSGLAAFGLAVLGSLALTGVAFALVVGWTLRQYRAGRQQLPKQLLWVTGASIAAYLWPLLGLFAGQSLREILKLHSPLQSVTPMTILLGLTVFRPVSIAISAAVLALGFAGVVRYDRG